jgi:hypothetical protein
MGGLITHVAGMDQALFYLVNGAWTNPLLDRLIPAFSRIGNAGAVWIALLLAIAAFVKKTGGWVGFRLAFVRRIRKSPDPNPTGRRISEKLPQVQYIP